MLDILQYQVRYAAWANERMLTAAGQLTAEDLTRDFGTADKSVLGTLAHVYRAERVWLARMQGEPVDFQVPGDDRLEALGANWPTLSARWMAWSDALSEDAAVRELSFKDRKGNEWSLAPWKIVLHVVNHSTHHRGQVAGFLRALGQTPPSVDSIVFARSE